MKLTIGTDYTVVAAPDNGYQLVNIKVGDTTILAKDTTPKDGKYYYKFTMGPSITKIDATFEQIPEPTEIDVTVGGKTDGTIGKPVSVDGGTVTIEVPTNNA